MKNECIDIELIPDTLELPSDDSRRRHVETCSRCSAVLASYQAFMKEETVAGADPEAAHTRLTAFVESEIGVTREEGESPARSSDPPRKGLLSRVTGTFFMRPAMAAAALVIVAAGVLWWRPWAPEEIVLRGSTPAGEIQPLVLSAPQILSEDEVVLDWTPMDGADSYQVHLYDEDLNTIVLFEPTVETTLVISRSVIPADAPGVLIWRVVALQKGDEIGSSDPVFLQIP